MARKSNKTAHVLNLIAAGHDNQKDTAEENTAETPGGEAGNAEEASPQPAKTAASPAAPNNISVIDTTTEDPVSDLIQQELNNSFADAGTDAASAQEETAPQTQAENTPQTPQSQLAPQEQAETTPQDPLPQATPHEQVPQSAPQHPLSQTAPQKQTPQTASQEQAPQVQTEAAGVSGAQSQPPDNSVQIPAPEPAAEETEPEPVLAPDFVRVNVMESIVNDKLIYFMRQFDVCTCDRCIADTAALALNGLMPKYMVTTPAAVDPLLSYYTNRLISDVTVEATKACMTVKDNPRH